MTKPAPDELSRKLIKISTRRLRQVTDRLYYRFGGSCHYCRAPLAINGSKLPGYRPYLPVMTEESDCPVRLACEQCAGGRLVLLESPPHGNRAKRKTSLRDKILMQVDPYCSYCGDRVQSQVARREDWATVDHMTPLSRGGTNARSNLVLACQSCNSAKSDMTVREFLRAVWLIAATM